MISHGFGVETTQKSTRRIKHLNTKGRATLRAAHFIFDCFMFFFFGGYCFCSLCFTSLCLRVSVDVISFCCISPPVYLDFIDVILTFLSPKKIVDNSICESGTEMS